MGTILVVDDDADLVETYKLALTQGGHEVQACPSAEQARKLLAKARPDAIVLDVMMETKVSGFELAREAHERYPDLPILMLTGVHQATDRAMHFEPEETWLPVARFLDKPVDPAVLAKEINAMLTG